MISPILVAATIGVSAAAMTSGCSSGGEVPSGPRLVVLYSTCTVSKDFLSPYRPGIEFTPNLRAFATESCVFDRHNSEAGQSGVAFASIYTGVQADRHGVFHHPRDLPESLYLVGEAFRDNGYRTHFWSGQTMAAADLGYGQGIDSADVYYTHKMFTKRAQELGEDFLVRTTANGPELDTVLDELASDSDLRAFLQINFTITHELYHEYASLEKIEAFRARYPAHATSLTKSEIRASLRFFEDHRHRLQLDHPAAVRAFGLTPEDIGRLDTVLQLAYKTCIEQLDDYFGRFIRKIDEAGLAKDSLIVFTADHGETFYHESEPLHWMHGLQLAPSVIEVPWIVRGASAGVRPGRRLGVTRSIDVFPTLAGLAGLSLPAALELDGVDLSTVTRDAPSASEDMNLVAFSHTTTLGAARVGRYAKEGYRTVMEMVPEPKPEHMWVRLRERDMVFEMRPASSGETRTLAFDLATDPRRANDVFDASNVEHANNASRLAAYRDRLIQSFDPSEGRSNREILERLEGLGYVGGDG